MLRGRETLPRGGAHKLVIQYQTASPENIHISNIIHTVQVVLMYLEIYIYIYAIRIKEKEDINLKERMYNREALKGERKREKSHNLKKKKKDTYNSGSNDLEEATALEIEPLILIFPLPLGVTN